MDNTIGRVVAVAGSQMTAPLEVDALTEDPVRIGAMVKVRSALYVPCESLSTPAVFRETVC